MSLVLMFFITYAVVLAIALVFTAVLCPRKSSLFVTFKDAAPSPQPSPLLWCSSS